MLKGREGMKSLPVERAASTALLDYLRRVPFLEISAPSRASGERHESGPELGPDLVVQVRTGDSIWTLVCECKTSAQPREVRSAVLQLERYLGSLDDRSRYGVVLAPFISEESARICTEAGIGYLDLSGNARLAFDRIFMESRAPSNAFKRKRELRSLFFPKSLRVLRVMLTGPIRPWKVTELAHAAHVSLGQVSNVRRQLLAREWAAVRDGGLELTRPQELLREWQAQSVRSLSSVRGRQVELFTLDRPAEFELKLAKASAALGLRCALTEMAAAARLAPMARYVRTRAYVDDVDATVAALGLKSVSTGSNIVLVEPADDGVFYGLRSFGDVSTVCPVQVYADLTTGGGRHDEAAETLLAQVIEKEWRPATR